MTPRLQLIDPLELIKKIPLAKKLKVNPWTIDQWRKKGLIPEPVVLSPQFVAWRVSDIEAWLEERKTNPVSTRAVARPHQQAPQSTPPSVRQSSKRRA